MATFKFLRNAEIFETYDKAIEALKERNLTDGEICMASYGSDFGSATTVFALYRATTDESGNKTGGSYTIYEPFKMSDIQLGNGLEFNEDGEIVITLDTDSENYLTVGENGLKLSGIDEIVEDYESRISSLENGATKDVLSIKAESVSSGNIELTGTSAIQSTITVSATNQYFNGYSSNIDASKLSLWNGSTEVVLNDSGKATVTLPTTASLTSTTYTGKMESSTTASNVSLTYKMLTRIYARYDTAVPSVNSFINSADGSTEVADSTTVRSNVVTAALSSTNQTLKIPVNGSGDKYVYFAVPSYLTVSNASLPDSLDATINISDTGTDITKNLGGGTQTWNVYVTESTFPSNATVNIKLK